MRHSGAGACGIPDGESVVMTGGYTQSFVTRYCECCWRALLQQYQYFLCWGGLEAIDAAMIFRVVVRDLKRCLLLLAILC